LIRCRQRARAEHNELLLKSHLKAFVTAKVYGRPASQTLLFIQRMEVPSANENLLRCQQQAVEKDN